MILVLGSNGQLGSDVVEELSSRDLKFKTFNRKNVNFEDLANFEIELRKIEFDFLINCTSFHKTNDVENDPEKAFKLNYHCPKIMAKICSEKVATLFHISTDYVFGGRNHTELIKEETTTSPLNIYGASKSLGENAVLNEWKNSYVLRVASLFGKAGASGKGGNFVETMISLAKEKKEINVVDDQIMTPTSTRFIAEVIVSLILNKKEYGIYHITNDHKLSWFNFAELIFNILDMKPSLNPINTSDLNLPAARPKFSALDNLKLKNSGIRVPSLSEELKLYLKEKGHL